jgi:hypothetical protein
VGRYLENPWQIAICAGVIAATFSLAIETPIVWFMSGELPWGAARMAAAMVLGPTVLLPSAFDIGVVLLAFIVHFALSIFYALILAYIIHGETAFAAALTGAAFGAVVFVVDLFVLTDIFFPWFVTMRDTITLMSHLILGGVSGWTYTVLIKKADGAR